MTHLLTFRNITHIWFITSNFNYYGRESQLITNEHTIMSELLKLGILRHARGQITLDEAFLDVLQAEMCHYRTDHKESLINIISRYFPNLDENNVLGFTAFIETYMLQN